jgi:hypothetical protein
MDRELEGCGVGLQVDVDEVYGAGHQIARTVNDRGVLAGVTVAGAADDEVSAGVAAALTRRFNVIATHSRMAAHVARNAATLLGANAAAYQGQEDSNAAALRSASCSAFATEPAVARSGLLLPDLVAASLAPPSLPVGIAAADAKMIASLLHRGAGPQPLLTAAAQARAHAGQLRDISADIHAAGIQLGQVWQSPAADAATDRIVTLAGWYGDHADHTEATAIECEAQADLFAQTRAATPHPAVFEDLERRLHTATQANVVAGGAYAPVIAELQTQLRATHQQALIAYADYRIRTADLGANTSTSPPASVQAVDYHLAPLPEEPGPADPNNPNQHLWYPERNPLGHYGPGNSGKDGDEAAQKAFDNIEQRDGVKIIRQEVRATITGPDGETYRRQYDGLQEIPGRPDTYIGMEHKYGSSRDFTQEFKDSLVEESNPARAVLNGRPITIVGTDLIRTPNPLLAPLEGPGGGPPEIPAAPPVPAAPAIPPVSEPLPEGELPSVRIPEVPSGGGGGGIMRPEVGLLPPL